MARNKANGKKKTQIITGTPILGFYAIYLTSM